MNIPHLECRGVLDNSYLSNMTRQVQPPGGVATANRQYTCQERTSNKPETSTEEHEHKQDHESLPDRITRVTADLQDLRQFYNIEISDIRYRRFHDYYTSELASLETAPFETYDQQSKVDYVLLRNYLKRSLRQLDLDRVKDKSMERLLPFADVIARLCEARQRGGPVVGQKVAKDIRDVVKSIAVVKEDIVRGRVCKQDIAREAAYRAYKTMKRLQEHLREFFQFYKGYDPLFTWWVQVEYEKANAELAHLATLIQEKLVAINPGSAGDIIGEPIGRDGLLADLVAEMIPYPPEELISIAENEDRWCVSEMKRASNELGYGDDWHGALEHVKNQYVEPGQQPQLVNDLLAEGIATVQDLVTVPPLATETWRMFMLSPEAQKVSPFFLGGDDILVAYPTDTMDFESKLMTMRGNNRHFSRATVFHEMIPGHHLQFHMLARHKPYRRLFDTPFWIEGWALYWEFVLWDKKFFPSPEDRIGTLFWRMHRCARILFSLKFHFGEWSPQQCVDYLVEHVGHERATAEGEVRRSFAGDYTPLYQAGYMLGALQLFALRKEMVDSGKMKEKNFHDFVLRQSMMPIEVLRALLTGQEITRDFRSSWKFYEGHQ